MDCIKKLKSRCKNCRCSVLSPSDARYYWGWGLIILVLVEVIPPSREWRRHLSETLTLPWAGRAVAGLVAPDCLVTAFLGSISAQLRGIARSSLARGETFTIYYECFRTTGATLHLHFSKEWCEYFLWKPLEKLVMITLLKVSQNWQENWKNASASLEDIRLTESK